MDTQMTVLVTGATGFVGRRTIGPLVEEGHRVRIASRQPVGAKAPGFDGIERFAVKALDSATDWGQALHGTNVVVHLAGRAHVMRESQADAELENRRVNYEGALKLAVDARRAGVQRFIFVSTAKVFGEASQPGRPFTPSDRPAPVGPYATSKALAEEKLHEVFSGSGTELVVIRPPLVYGPGVRGNFRRLLQFAGTPFPVPFAGASNKRSMVYVDNLASFIGATVSCPGLDGRLLLPTDAESYTISELFSTIRTALHRPPRLARVPRPIMSAVERNAAKHPALGRLFGNFELHGNTSNAALRWHPPVGFVEAIEATVTDRRPPRLSNHPTRTRQTDRLD